MQKKQKKTALDIFQAKNPVNGKESYKLSMITAYDATSARLAERAGADILLVGDSLAMTMQGMSDTNGVNLDEMIYHTKIVTKNAPNTMVVMDMPFLSYEISVEQVLENASKILRETGVRALKLEGAKALPQIKALVEAGVPVMGHLGLTPQRANVFGGFKAQAKNAEAAKQLLKDALALQDAGCFCVVLEAIPAVVAAHVSKTLTVPTIGIGAGKDCDGQVLVFHDMLGLSDHCPRFVKKYIDLAPMVEKALAEYINDVQTGAFPSDEHTFSMGADEVEKFFKE